MESSVIVTVAEGRGTTERACTVYMGQGTYACTVHYGRWANMYSYASLLRIQNQSSRVQICQESTVEHAAPTVEMDEKIFGLIIKWGGHGCPSRYASNALVLHGHSYYNRVFLHFLDGIYASIIHCGGCH